MKDRQALETELQLRVLAARRAAMLGLRAWGTISDQVMRRGQDDGDLEEMRLTP